MEKKKYETPKMKEYVIENEGALLAGSSPGTESGGKVDTDDQASLWNPIDNSRIDRA